jgi:hypothetical protein
LNEFHSIGYESYYELTIPHLIRTKMAATYMNGLVARARLGSGENAVFFVKQGGDYRCPEEICV